MKPHALLLVISTFLLGLPGYAQEENQPDTLDPKALVKGDRDFLFSTGANFDFVDGMKPNSVYIDLRASVPGDTRFGLDFKINRFRTFSSVDSSRTDLYDIDPVIQADTLAGLSYITTTMRTKRSTRFDNIGVAVTPRLFLFGDTSSRRAFRLDLIAGVEWFRSESQLTLTRSFERTVSDSVPDEWPRPYHLTSTLPAEEEVIKSTADILYFSGGLKLSYRNAYGILNTQIYAGLSRSKYTQSAGSGTLLSIIDDGFWGFQAEIIETRKSGVKIGVEVRGYMSKLQPTLERNLAWSNVYIAKEFSLEKIGELFSAN